MKIEIWAVGKLKDRELSANIEKYLKRMRKYQPVDLVEIKVRAKSKEPDLLRKLEADKIRSRLSTEDYLILMDENGQTYNSENFARFLQKTLLQQTSRVVFLIGGAWGFDPVIYNRAQSQISLSAMTFPHDLVRLLMAEQLYRAFSILHHSPYHH